MRLYIISASTSTSTENKSASCNDSLKLTRSCSSETLGGDAETTIDVSERNKTERGIPLRVYGSCT